MDTTRSAAALFLDRDGTIIVDTGYPNDPVQVRPLPGAADALRALQASGLRLVLISNQSGIGRGYITEGEAEAVHREVLRQFAERGVTFDGAYYCPHAPEAGCACRKPEPGLLQRAAADLDLDLAQSYMIGDKPSDVEAGRRVGATALLFAPPPATPENAGGPVVEDWEAAVRYILEHHAQEHQL